MIRHDLLQIIADSRLFKHWHWFRYHFGRSLSGLPHPLAESIISACLECESKSQGFASNIIERLAAVGGRNRHLPDWEQLLQQLAELHVVHRVLTWNWASGAAFAIEPHGEGSKKNPEVVVTLPDLRIGIEVKAPSLFTHVENRTKNPTQIASRFAPKEVIDAIASTEAGVTMPRDNPVKDYLVSAEAKFAPFRQKDPNFFGILVIVWDDFIYEPISALLQTDSGLFTRNSFFRGPDGNHIVFPSIAGVVIIRHLNQLVRACRDEALMDGCRSPLDYGRAGQFPWKALVQNPWGPEVPLEAIQALDARPPADDMGAEYRPQEFIVWIDMPR
jgi:hypothetical protein